jgi:predicted amidohydrolase
MGSVFQLACLQTKPIKGDLKATFNHLAESIRQAVDEGADLVVLPESAVTGYILEGAVESQALSLEELGQELVSRLSMLKKPVDIAIGFYQKSNYRPYNATAYLALDGASVNPLCVYHKFFLPTYGVFDEHRFHQEGKSLGLVETRFGRVGLLICEDVWHSILPSLLAVAGAELILVHCASPAREFHSDKPDNLIRYDLMLQMLCQEHGIFAAMSMLAGFEGGKGLTGGSQVVNPMGDQLVQAKTFGEQIVMAPIDLNLVRQARAAIPLATDLRERWPDLLKMANLIKLD